MRLPSEVRGGAVRARVTRTRGDNERSRWCWRQSRSLVRFSASRLQPDASSLLYLRYCTANCVGARRTASAKSDSLTITCCSYRSCRRGQCSCINQTVERLCTISITIIANFIISDIAILNLICETDRSFSRIVKLYNYYISFFRWVILHLVHVN